MSTEHDMSDLLARLHAAFDSHPILVSDLPVREAAPTDVPGAHVVLADALAALANASEGGVVVFGLDPRPPHACRGVRDVAEWTTALHDAADALVPSVQIEVEPGEEDGNSVLAAFVPYTHVVRGHVHRRHAPPCRIARGRVEPWFPPLRAPPEPLARQAMLLPVERSTPWWIDSEVARRLGHPHPGGWDRDVREALREGGLLAGDGVRLTRAGVLVAARPEHRPDGATVLVERDDAVDEVACGWLRIRRVLRAAAKAAGHGQPEVVADFVLDALVRTATWGASDPVVVDVSADLVTIEAPRAATGDAVLPRVLARFSPWRRSRWKTLAACDGLVVEEEPRGRGLFVQLRSTRRTVRPASKPVSAPPSRTPEAQAPASRESEILTVLADGQPWTRRKLGARLGWSRSTLRRVMVGLVQDGRVVPVVASPRSPHQAYRAA